MYRFVDFCLGGCLFRFAGRRVGFVCWLVICDLVYAFVNGLHLYFGCFGYVVVFGYCCFVVYDVFCCLLPDTDLEVCVW